MVQPLDVTKYRNVYEPEKVQCASTEEMRPMEEIIGQERALRALRFGLEIREPGFNVYTAGDQGTGRMTAVRSFLDELAKANPGQATGSTSTTSRTSTNRMPSPSRRGGVCSSGMI